MGIGIVALVGSRTWHNVGVVEPDADEECRHTVEHETPRKGFLIAKPELQHTGSRNQYTIAKDDGQTIERVADAHKPHLLVVVEFKHVIAVGSNVVRGTGERHEEEEGHRALEPKRRIQREGDTRQRRAQQQLHGKHPPTLGAIEIDEGAP